MVLDWIAAAGPLAVAIVVPWLAFRFALRQEERRWFREQRAQLYVDLLTEAVAEEQYFEYATADDDAREEMRKRRFVDLRLSPSERARLGARGNAFGSRKVTAAFNQVQRAAALYYRVPNKHEGHRIAGRVELGSAREELEAAIRAELGADGKH
jgi:hypothetical protein